MLDKDICKQTAKYLSKEEKYSKTLPLKFLVK